MKVIGIRPSSFKGDKGQDVNGVSFYLSYPLDKDGSGFGVMHAFVHEKRLQDMTYVPEVGDEVEVMYNRYGKVASFRKVK